jgi:hypothetical protein
VCRPLVASRKHLAHGRRHVGCFVVFAGERAHRVERVEGHDDCELDLVAGGPAEQIAALEAGEAAREAWEYLLARDALVGICFLGCCPPSPVPEDQRSLL